jgi:riboflavin biosynthesis pyrimidine reductase
VLIIAAAHHSRRNVDHDNRSARLLERGAAIEEVSVSGEATVAGAARLSLPEVLDSLGRREVNELWVESGPRLAGDLLRQRLADELIVYIAPKLLGPQARPLAELGELHELSTAPGFVILDTCQIGDDVRLRLRPRHEQG